MSWIECLFLWVAFCLHLGTVALSSVSHSIMLRSGQLNFIVVCPVLCRGVWVMFCMFQICIELFEHRCKQPQFLLPSGNPRFRTSTSFPWQTIMFCGSAASCINIAYRAYNCGDARFSCTTSIGCVSLAVWQFKDLLVLAELRTHQVQKTTNISNLLQHICSCPLSALKGIYDYLTLNLTCFCSFQGANTQMDILKQGPDPEGVL